MMSIRTFSRTISRPLAQLPSRCASRSFASIPRPALSRLRPLKASSRPLCATFSTTRAAFEKEGQVDQELSAKIESELQMEQEIRDSEKLPVALSDFLKSSSFELHDTPGSEEVVLTRKFGDENIRVSFSIADLNAGMVDEEDLEDDKSLYDEPDPSNADTLNNGAANAKANEGKNVVPAAGDSIEDEEVDEASSADPSFPSRLTVTITKPGSKSAAGTLQLNTTAQDGEIVIESIGYFSSPSVAEAGTAEADWKRKNIYAGPPFGNLDEDLQILLERYLDERGVNTLLALWVPEYIDWKEQREYLSWLSNMKSFVEA